MANREFTSRYPIAGSFFSANCYNPPLPARFCAFRQFSALFKSFYSNGQMETLCVAFKKRPTSIKTDLEKIRLIFEALLIQSQHGLSLLGATSLSFRVRCLSSLSP